MSRLRALLRTAGHYGAIPRSQGSSCMSLAGAGGASEEVLARAEAQAWASACMPPSAPLSTSGATHAAAAPGGSSAGGAPQLLGPSVKILLQGSGLDPASIPGTGPRGIITKGDVLQALAKRGPAPAAAAAPPTPRATPAAAPVAPAPKAAAASAAPPSPRAAAPLMAPAGGGGGGAGPGMPESQQLPTTQMRKIIAKRLLESKLGSPHFYAEGEAVIDQTLSLRKRLKESLGVSVSVNDFVIKAVAAALHQVPEANVIWDAKAEALVPGKGIDISVAVATDKGLYTPIVKDAYSKSLSAISQEVKALAAKARSGKLQPHEYQGGCFSISNLGMFPIDRFAAIINPPQPCILAVGRGERVARWLSQPASAATLLCCGTRHRRQGAEDVPAVVTKMEVTLSADARALGPKVAGKFLEALCANLKDPTRLIV